MIHPLPPVCGKDSRVLLLGTMPSPKSREAGFYYAHPRNRFWTVLAQIFEEPAPEGTDVIMVVLPEEVPPVMPEVEPLDLVLRSM